MPGSRVNQHPTATRPIAAVMLIGGRPSLDFVNTIHDRFAIPAEDYLVDARALLDWSERAGVLAAAERRGIAASHGDNRPVAEARRFREHLHAIFAARVVGRTGPAPALKALEDWVHRAWRDLRLQAEGANLRWKTSVLDVSLPLRRIALDAVDLLQGPASARLKVCAAAGECGWMFVDGSKNDTRNWCSMNTCGAIWKMRRYRGRRAR